MSLDIMIDELYDYSRALDKRDREILDSLLKRSRLHSGALGNAGSIHTWAFLLLSIAIEQEKRIIRIESKYRLPREEELAPIESLQK